MVASRMGGSCGSCEGGVRRGWGSVGADEAAVDADLLAGDVAGLLGGEEGTTEPNSAGVP